MRALGGMLAALLPLAGCTSAMPLLAGGGTTQQGLAAATAGGAARVPVGRARPDAPEGSLAHAAGAGGVVPAAGTRVGVARHWDAGLFVAGTDVRLEGRREIVLEEASTRPSVLLGAGLVAGYVDDDGLGDAHPASGGRFGVEVPAVYAVEFGPVYDLWMGVRLGAEHLRGQFRAAPEQPMRAASATTLRAGAVVGLGAGFRRLHAQLELTAYYEAWLGEPEDSGLEGGLVLVPAFALRVRL
ncbi:MAG: hypothetical protein ACODAU_12385 [Myxococcota bacterium]